MSKKIAKLVSFTLTTRVVVDVNATDADCIQAALPKVTEIVLNNELSENLEDIMDDTEVPYGTLDGEK